MCIFLHEMMPCTCWQLQKAQQVCFAFFTCIIPKRALYSVIHLARPVRIVVPDGYFTIAVCLMTWLSSNLPFLSSRRPITLGIKSQHFERQRHFHQGENSRLSEGMLKSTLDKTLPAPFLAGRAPPGFLFWVWEVNHTHRDEWWR